MSQRHVVIGKPCADCGGTDYVCAECSTARADAFHEAAVMEELASAWGAGTREAEIYTYAAAALRAKGEET